MIWKRCAVLTGTWTHILFRRMVELFLTYSSGGPSSAARLETSRMTRLNAVGVMEGIPRISPNGRWLAIVKGVRGDFDVFIRPAQGGGPELRVSQDSGVVSHLAR